MATSPLLPPTPEERELPTKHAERAALNNSEVLRARADAGDAGAQYTLGWMYEGGRGVPPDFVQAAAWYRKAAEQGHVIAQCNLGTMYLFRGLRGGGPRDYARAAPWLRKAAEQGASRAQYNLGRMYQSGSGVQQDYGQAAMWFRKAADQGHPNAQQALGDMHADGDGVPQVVFEKRQKP